MQLLSDAVAAFTSNGVPVAHVRFHETPAPPYARVFLNDSQYNHSDNRAHRTFCEYDVILYTTDRDLALEASIEDALTAAQIIPHKSGGYLANEDLVTTTFQIEVYER